MTRPWIAKRLLVAALVALPACGPTPAEYDAMTRGAPDRRDGCAPATGGRGDRMAAIGEVEGDGKLTIDATGKYRSPTPYHANFSGPPTIRTTA